MPTTKSGKQVGDEMSLYSFRPGPVREAFPRGGESVGSVLRIFDKGHFRAVAETTGFRIINGQKIQFTDGIPVGFTKVPLRTLLKYYGSRFTLNVRKMERALEDYHTRSLEYQKLREASEQVRRPRRPTLNSLYLERPTEFEFFLQPYISFYCNRLKANFRFLVRLAENEDDSVFTKMNEYYHPNRGRDDAVQARFTSAGGKFVCVRLSEPFEFTEAPPESAPIGTKPYTVKDDPVVEMLDRLGAGDASVSDPIIDKWLDRLRAVDASAIEVGGGDDEEKTEAELFLEDQEIRGVEYACLYMKPWECVLVDRNPFKSRTYQTLYKNAQVLYEREFVNFKDKMQNERNEYHKELAKYTEMKRQKRDASVDLKSIKHFDRPQSRNFTKEWEQFIFMMLEKMRKHRIYADAPETAVTLNLPGATITANDPKPEALSEALEPVALKLKIVSEPLVVTKRTLKTLDMKPLRAVMPRVSRVPFLKETQHKLPEDPHLALIMRDKSYSKGVVMI